MNFWLETERVLLQVRASGLYPRLLLHACCAPCSARALEVLADAFDITLYFDNPNIFPEAEHDLRRDGVFRLSEIWNREMSPARHVKVIAPVYDHARFLAAARGLESEPEGGARCFACFDLRLRAARDYARENGYAWFGTTLTTGPRKSASAINGIGARLTCGGAEFLPCDLKKKDGYLSSIRLSERFGLYRQRYCGCEMSNGGEI
ncbi:MAG: epoxyqueuosine reductase QueH [Oscillospiraceae bacterium]|jgi:predicted adenine nucleotide alpha hydrolase (AANH) superfamily ATPase|nr:epoxyqueuosine reductase QueH [Oscillospiraceae bacterium]